MELVNKEKTKKDSDSTKSKGVEELLFKIPSINEPLVGTPKEVQEQLDKIVLDIQIDPSSKKSDYEYERILLYMHSYLVNVVLKQFPFIRGMDHSDTYQEALIALRFKAIPNFKVGKGMSFLNFAKMCIRRHLITILNASKNRQREFQKCNQIKKQISTLCTKRSRTSCKMD